MRRNKGPKYHNTKLKDMDGNAFDSKKEFRRWRDLQLLERAGHISDLRRQVKFILIPAQREPDRFGPRGGKIPGRTIEKECDYIADFVYVENGETVVEDAKGVRTEAYKIKRKLMLERYGIRVRET